MKKSLLLLVSMSWRAPFTDSQIDIYIFLMIMIHVHDRDQLDTTSTSTPNKLTHTHTYATNPIDNWHQMENVWVTSTFICLIVITI